MGALDPAAYAWLCRYDRAWLDEHKPDRIAIKTELGAPRILWDARDEALSLEVSRAVKVSLEIATCECGQLICWTDFHDR